MCTCKRWLNYNKDYTSLTYVSSVLVVLSTALFELNTDVTTYSRFASYATTCSLRLSRCFSSLSSNFDLLSFPRCSPKRCRRLRIEGQLLRPQRGRLRSRICEQPPERCAATLERAAEKRYSEQTIPYFSGDLAY